MILLLLAPIAAYLMYLFCKAVMGDLKKETGYTDNYYK